MSTYRIIKSEKMEHQAKPVESTEVVGITGWAEADSQRNKLQTAENEAHPERSSWTRTLYIVEMEKA